VLVHPDALISLNLPTSYLALVAMSEEHTRNAGSRYAIISCYPCRTPSKEFFYSTTFLKECMSF
jgi:hypothetical protein